MASYSGALCYDTRIDTSGFNKGLNEITGSVKGAGSTIKNIVAALGIDRIISAGMNTISESVGSAMKRIDTMEQFTRVMTAMTGSTKLANNALENIKETVTGTAYGLDVAARSTQKFVTSGMELEKSTQQIKTWANAVAFYSDGTNESFENVTDALAQMVAKGKVEMDQLNRLTDAGIPAVQIYADYVGKSVQEVQDMLSDGTISTVEFLDDLQIAFNEGTSRFASISNAAQEAGASWTGSFDNFKAAITRGMVNIIDSIDEGLESIGLDDMRTLISKIGKEAEKVMQNIAKKIPSVIKQLKNMLPIIKSVGAAFITWKVGTIVKDIQKSFGSLKTELINIATTAKQASTAYNGFMTLLKANAVNLAITGIVALGTALLTSKARIDEEKQAILDETDTLQKNIAERNKMQESIAKNINNGLSEIQYYQNLYNELTRIVDENGKVKEGYEDRASFIVSTLNEAMGLEMSLIDGTVQNYQELTSTFDEVIAKKKAMIILNAQEEAYTEAIKNQTAAQEELGKAYSTLKNYRQQLVDLEKEQSEIYADPFDEESRNRKAEIDSEIAQLKDKIDKQTDLYNTAKKNYNQYAYDIATYEDNMAKYQAGKYNEMIYQTYDYVSKKKSADTTELENLQSQLIAEQQTLEQLKENKKKYNTDIYDNQIASSEARIEQLKTSIEQEKITIANGNAEMANQWIAGIQQQLSAISGQQFLFQNLGDGTIQMYIDGIKTGEPIAQDEMESFANVLINQLTNSNNGKYENIGRNAVAGVAVGISDPNALSQITSAVSNVVSKIQNTFSTLLDINSPSKVMANISKCIPEGVAVGIEANTKMAEDAIAKLDDSIVEKMKQAVSLETSKINANATIKANNSYNVIQLNASFDGAVNLDSRKVGQVITPVISKTLKAGGIR